MSAEKVRRALRAARRQSIATGMIDFLLSFRTVTAQFTEPIGSRQPKICAVAERAGPYPALLGDGT